MDRLGLLRMRRCARGYCVGCGPVVRRFVWVWRVRSCVSVLAGNRLALGKIRERKKTRAT